MVDVTCYNGASGDLSKVTVDDSTFGDKVKKRLLRQACLHYAAAHRLGCHSTLTRGEVSLTGRKPFRQKGTGRARAGDFKSPIWKGGGVVFGPKPRNYTSGFPRKARKAALKSALLGKLQDDEVRLVDGLEFKQPRTKDAVAILDKLGADGKKATLVIAERGENLFKSFRNLKKVDIQMASDLNAEHVVRADLLVVEKKALDLITARLTDA